MDNENKRASPLLPHQVAEIERVRGIDRITINFSELTKDQRDMMDDLDRLSVPVGAPVEREKPSDPFMVRVAPHAAMVAEASLLRSAMPALGAISRASQRLRQTCADAAWFMFDRHGLSAASLWGSMSGSIIRGARQYGFVPDSDREHVAGRVVKWELIDAARAILAILDHPTLPVTSFDADRLRKALEDL